MFELCHAAEFIGAVYGADGPGVRIVNEYEKDGQPTPQVVEVRIARKSRLTSPLQLRTSFLGPFHIEHFNALHPNCSNCFMQIADSRTGRQDADFDRVDVSELSQHKKLLGSHTLIETFPIRLPDGREWVGSLWKTPSRYRGRRIQVRDHRGAGLFDTGDCYDQGNATNALELWLQEKMTREDCADTSAAASEDRSVRESDVAPPNGARIKRARLVASPRVRVQE